MSYNKKKHLLDNIEAIRLAFTLEKENRTASTQEKEILKKYNGFGALSCILLPCSGDPEDREMWSKSEYPLYPHVYDLHQLIRQNSRNEKEYKAYLSSLSQSTLSAFYTPPPVAASIANALYHAGIRPGRILEPSAGNGIFMEAFKRYTNAPIYAYENDLITGKILSHIYPDDKITIDGFETIQAKQSFNIIASNIPFGSYPVYDPDYSNKRDKIKFTAAKYIHSYYFHKSIDLLAEGGVLAYITSQGFTDSPSHNELRHSLMQNCNLISAIRLPENLFNDFSNVQVGTDLIILQKDSQKTALSKREKEFSNTRTLSNGASINNYFMDFSSVIHTKVQAGKNPYGNPSIQFFHKGDIETISQQLQKRISLDCLAFFSQELFRGEQALSGHKPDNDSISIYDLFGISEKEKEILETKSHAVEPAGKDRTLSFEDPLDFFYKEGILLNYRGTIGYIKSLQSSPYPFQPLEVNPDERSIIEDYIRLRDNYLTLYETEKINQKRNDGLREELNNAYQTFCQNHGDLNSKNNINYILQDPYGREILSLEYFEKGNKHLSEIFTSPVSFVENKQTIVSADEALTISLNQFGKVNILPMAHLARMNVADLIEELADKIYFNPLENEYEIKSVFICDDVITKRENIQKFIEDNPDHPLLPECKRSVRALQKATPPPIPFDDLEFNFGERWIPKDYYERYLSSLFKTEVEVHHFKSIDQFFLDSKEDTAEITDKYNVNSADGTSYNGKILAKDAFHDVKPTILMKVGDDYDTDKEATQLAHTIINNIRDGFMDWLQCEPKESQNRLTQLYNRTYNCSVKPEMDGTFQRFPNLQMGAVGIKDDLYRSQYDATWLIKKNNGGLIAHDPGGGKTMIMIIAAYEMKRLKLCNKPLILCLQNNIAQIVEDFKNAYPDAKVLFPSERDFLPKNRMNLFNRIKSDNWDAVILTHDQFIKIPQSLHKQKELIEDEIYGVEKDFLDQERITGEKVSKQAHKGLQRRINSLKKKLKELNDKINARKDNVIDFEAMGFDHMLVDEIHRFKNLFYTTRHSYVAGLGNPMGSQKAFNLFIALRTIQDKLDRDYCATFLSGTPISNSLVELYLYFKYLRPRALARQNITTFDSWAAVYAQKSTDYEFDVTNQVKPKTRFRRYIKLPELSRFYAEMTDYRSINDIKKDRPKTKIVLKTLPATPQQQEYLKKLIRFAETKDPTFIDRAKLTENEEKGHMLIVTGLANKMALDMRLIDPVKYKDEPGNKLSICAKELAETYYKCDSYKGTQLVFFDLGTPHPPVKKQESDKIVWDCFTELKRKLVEDYHLPAEEICAIQQAKNRGEREQMIMDTRIGKIRIMCGSTEILGTGSNMQNKVVRGYLLTIPYKPSPLIQAVNRGGRPGNEVAPLYLNNEVEFVIFAHEHTLDLFKFNLNAIKIFFIEQFEKGNIQIRSMDESSISENNINFAAMMAALENNPDLQEKFKLEKKISFWESERQAYNNSLTESRYKYEDSKEELGLRKAMLVNLTKDWNHYNQVAPNGENGERNVVVSISSPYQTDTSFGENIHQLKESMNTKGRYESIGSFCDFNILVQTKYFLDKQTNHFFIEGKYKYSYNNGSIDGPPEETIPYFLKALDKLPELIKKTEADIQHLEKQVPVLKEIIETPWQKEKELENMKNRLKEIEKKLSDQRVEETKPTNEPLKIESTTSQAIKRKR